MTTKDEDFIRRLRATFKVEAEEHVQAMATGVLELEKAPGLAAQHRLVETVFRAAHSLKGAARAVDFTDIESRCQSLEDMFAAWKRQQSAPTRDALDIVHRTLDAVSAALTVPGPLREPASAPPSSSEPARAVSGPSEAVSAVPAAADRPFSSEDTVRITVAKLDAHLL